MFRCFLPACLAAAAFLAAPCVFGAERFHAPGLAASVHVVLEAPREKRSGATIAADGRLQIGFERALDKAVGVAQWNAVDGGHVARIEASSPQAEGLRVKLDLGTVPGAFEVRAMGSDGVVQSATIDPLLANEFWTPWTPGDTQSIELFSRVAPSNDALRVSALMHFTESPLVKAAAACTLSTACSANDPTYDAAITERKKSIMRIQFVDGGGAFVCTATLIETPAHANFTLTANHCINNAASATSVNAFWFYEETSCGSGIAPLVPTRTNGGTQIVFTNFNIDSTLLLMNGSPPAGALFAPLNAGLLAKDQSVVSVSHPRGDTSRYAIGAFQEQGRDADRPIDMYLVSYTRGIIEPGSSGSGLFTMSNGHLELRGVLSQAADSLSCANPTAVTLYGRLEAFYPEIAQYIGAQTVASDDAPNRPQDLFLAPITTTGLDVPLDLQPGTFRIDNRRIDYAGDLDVYRFFLANPAVVTVYTEGPIDSVGTILDSSGSALLANDDANFLTGDNNFGMTIKLGAGTHYVSVGHWDPQGTGSYSLRLRTEPVDANYTDLWWNPAESGWGVNFNHQGNILFGTLFTYDASGAPTWLVMSSGIKQPDGSYQGDLYQLRGSAFNAAWTGTTLSTVGTMKFAPVGADNATLVYTFNGTQVVKSITRQAFAGTAPVCGWSAFDRSFVLNFQDLWYDAAESGWGMNLTQHDDTMFATLFVYGSDGKPQWYVMSAGKRSTSSFLSFTGPLYRTTGPAFNASPWTSAQATEVGTMKLDFENGRKGTLTYTVNGIQVVKPITRQVFSTPATDCGS
jgi:lysyl endopeptidase